MLTNCISEINRTQIDNARDIDAVMPMYNLIEYSSNFLKTSESLWRYCRGEPVLTDPDWSVITNFLVIMFRLNLNKTQRVQQEMIVQNNVTCWNNGTIKMFK